MKNIYLFTLTRGRDESGIKFTHRTDEKYEELKSTFLRYGDIVYHQSLEKSVFYLDRG